MSMKGQESRSKSLIRTEWLRVEELLHSNFFIIIIRTHSLSLSLSLSLSVVDTFSPSLTSLRPR